MFAWIEFLSLIAALRSSNKHWNFFFNLFCYQ